MSPPNRTTPYPGSFRQMSERVKAAAVRKLQRERAEAVPDMPISHQRNPMYHEPLLASNPFANAPGPDSSLVSSNELPAINERAIESDGETTTDEEPNLSAFRIQENPTAIDEISPTSSDEDSSPDDFTNASPPRPNSSNDEPSQNIRSPRPSAIKRPPGKRIKAQQKHTKPASRLGPGGTNSNESSSSPEMHSVRGQDPSGTNSKPLTPFDISRLESEDEQCRRQNRKKARKAFWEDFWAERGRRPEQENIYYDNIRVEDNSDA